MNSEFPLERLQEMDERRPSFPGEHWLVLGLGIALLVYARRRPPFVRSIATAAGTALIARSATGRDGIKKVLD